MSIIMLSKDNCAACAKLERYLKAHGAAFEIREIREGNAQDLSDLRTDYGFFGKALPALVVGHRIYEYNDLFAADGHVLDLGGILACQSQ